MFFLYLLIWLVFTMDVNIQTLIVGAVLSAFIYRFACKHMRYSLKTDLNILKNIFLGLKYAATLIWETAVSNALVFRVVFSRTIEVAPRIIYFRTGLKTNAARVALANSITLTPGTLTVALNGDTLCVHCLNGKLAEGIEDSVFVKQLRRFEKSK